MPLDPGVRFRVKTNPDGSKIRLAFKNNKVVETKKKGEKVHKISDKKLKRTVLGARAS